jgi:hypothetical protein
MASDSALSESANILADTLNDLKGTRMAKHDFNFPASGIHSVNKQGVSWHKYTKKTYSKPNPKSCNFLKTILQGKVKKSAKF